MSRSDLERLQDVCDFARHAKRNAGGLDADEFADVTQPQHAALFDLVIIGEALKGFYRDSEGSTHRPMATDH